MLKPTLFGLAGRVMIAFAITSTAGTACSEAAPGNLAQAIERLDAKNPGELGVYAKHLGKGQTFGHHNQQDWYIASLVKVPLAIAVLQAVERGELSLDEQLELKESDFVDGSGNLLFHKPGERFSIADLIQQSLEHSDSTATDMLIRRLGVDNFNRQVEQAIAPGLPPLTTILQVRYDAFKRLHPDAGKLSNLDYVAIRSAGEHRDRIDVFRKKLNLKPEDLHAKTLEQAFEQYYQTGVNAGSLNTLGSMLERLVRGELLNKNHTALLLSHMERITTGDSRLRAGLPEGAAFAQKTGTQINRACNMGVVYPRDLNSAVVIAVCSQGHGELPHAEKAFAQVAEALGDAGWF